MIATGYLYMKRWNNEIGGRLLKLLIRSIAWVDG